MFAQTFGVVPHRLRPLMALIAVTCCGFDRPAFPQDKLQYPLAVVVAPDKTVYVADRDLPGVWKFSGGAWSIHFKGEKKFRTPLNAVRCLAIDHQGRLLAGDSATREIYRFDTEGKPTPLTKGEVGIPMVMAVAKEGTIFVSDLETKRIVKVPADGGEPVEVTSLRAVRGLALDQDGSLIAVTHGEAVILKLSADGKSQEKLLEGRPFQFSHQVVIAENGDRFIADGYAKTIWKQSGREAPTALLEGNPLKNPVGLALDGEDLLIADPHAKAIFRRKPDGTIATLGTMPN